MAPLKKPGSEIKPETIVESVPQFEEADDALPLMKLRELVERQQSSFLSFDVPLREFERRLALNKFKLYRALRLDAHGEEKTERWLKEAEIGFRKSSKLAAKVSKLIWEKRDERGRRASEDARVLEAMELEWGISADSPPPALDEVLQWIEEEGGLDAIRKGHRSTPKTPLPPEADPAESIADARPKEDPIVASFKKCRLELTRRQSIFDAEFQPKNAEIGDVVIAIGMVNSDGITDFRKISCIGDGDQLPENPFDLVDAELEFHGEMVFELKRANRKGLSETRHIWAFDRQSSIKRAAADATAV